MVLILSLLSTLAFASQKVSLQLSWMHQFQFAGYYVAKDLGYYEKVGLDVVISESGSKTNLFDVVDDKKADFSIWSSALLVDKINGKDVVALGAIFQESPMILMTRDDTGVESLKDLKNKRLMLTGSAKDSASIFAMLFSCGLTQSDLKILPHSFNLDDLVNKHTDAMLCYVSNEPIRMADQGVGYKIFNPKDYGFHFYDDILFTSSGFIKKNPKLTKDFYEASIKGWEYAFENIAQTAEIIHRRYNTQNKTLIQLVKEGEALKRLAFHENGSIGYLDKSKLEDIVNVYKLFGLVKKDADLDGFVYEYNHPKEFAFKLNYNEILHLFLVVALVLASGAFAILFVSFRKKWLLTKKDLYAEILKQKEEIQTQHDIILQQSKIVAMGDTVSNIAHQWRQPLNVISLSVAQMETSLLLGKEIKTEDLLALSAEINAQTQYLSQTVDDFRNYANSSADKVVEFNLRNAIEKVCLLTKENYRANRVEVVANIKDCVLTQNESLLIQSLLNIFNNAKDAMVEKGVVQKCFFIDVACDESSVSITLKDSGGGVSEDILDKIFDPYFTTKNITKGSGLGLYITHGIVTEHLGGSIVVHTVRYKYKDLALSGAEFVITIPRVAIKTFERS